MKKGQLALVLSLFAIASGCTWESSVYSKYVGEADSLFPCSGHCDTIALNITTRETCDEFSGQWIEAKCLEPENELPDEPLTEELCIEAVGTYQKAYCSNVPREKCENNWYDFAIKELKDGRYIRKTEDNTYKCGDYNAIMSDESLSANCTQEEIADFKTDLSLKICNKSSSCQLAYYRNPEEKNSEIKIKAVTAMCATCGEGMVVCATKQGATCTDIINNAAHCGACGNACGTNKYCENGQCIDRAMCSPEQIKCYCSIVDNMQIVCSSEPNDTGNFQCFDPSNNETCGITSCAQYNTPDIQCSGDTKCQNIGSDEAKNYVCQCPQNTVKLEHDSQQLCVSPLSEEYCGITQDHPEIFETCKDGRICDGQKCQCPSGTQECNGECIDTKSSQTHCGACDNACKNNETCILSSCKCNSGGKCGSDVCTDNTENHDHCGGKGDCNSMDIDSENYQGLICAEKEICKNSACVCDESKYAFCNGSCIDPKTDIAFCGAEAGCKNYEDCNQIQGTSCLDGKCTCPEGMVRMKAADGAFKCFDTQSDPTCCGGNEGDTCYNCGNMLCVNGRCLDTTCDSGLINCQNRCLHPENNHVQQISVADKTCACKKDYCDNDDNPNNGCLDQKIGDLNHCFGCNKPCAIGYTLCTTKNGNPTCACQEQEHLCIYKNDDKNDIHCYTPQDMQNLHLEDCEKCAPGWAKHSDTPWIEGCQINLKTTTEHCGQYETDCNAIIKNATSPYCDNGSCNYKDCISPFGNCDTNKSNGCETNLDSTHDSCKVCGNKCGSNQNCQRSACCYHDNEDIGANDICCTKKYRQEKCFGGYRYKCASSTPSKGISFCHDWHEI
ncbi:MAG: hypothetical protein IKY83_06410 [Proteobacteria bacterium]|nr:hypothetical protein [Pseudomonadota bacterium]